MILKNKTDVCVSKCGLGTLAEFVRIRTIERNAPGRRRVERTKYVEECALAAAGRTGDRDRVAAIQTQRNAVEDREFAPRCRIRLLNVRGDKHVPAFGSRSPGC